MQGRTERGRRGAVPPHDPGRTGPGRSTRLLGWDQPVSPGAVLCGVLAVGVVAVVVVGAVLAPEPLPVSTDEARGVMAATRSVALEGGDVCRGAGSAGLCERSRDAVRGQGPATTTVVSDRQLQDGSRVVEVTGRLTSAGGTTASCRWCVRGTARSRSIRSTGPTASSRARADGGPAPRSGGRTRVRSVGGDPYRRAA